MDVLGLGGDLEAAGRPASNSANTASSPSRLPPWSANPSESPNARSTTRAKAGRSVARQTISTGVLVAAIAERMSPDERRLIRGEDVEHAV